MCVDVYIFMCMYINSLSAKVKLEVPTSNDVSIIFFFFQDTPRYR